MTQVSYIVAVDNQCSRLDAMLKSLREQEGDFSREFVFVDDGSTDGLFDALIEKTRLWPRTLLIQQRRQGPAVAALAGAKAATGDVWLFLDGDLVLAPWATRLLLAALRDNRLDMILAAHVLSDDPVTFAFDLPETPPEIAPIEDATHALLSAVTVPPSRMMIRRALFRDPGFFDPGIFLPDFLPPLQASLGGADRGIAGRGQRQAFRRSQSVTARRRSGGARSFDGGGRFCRGASRTFRPLSSRGGSGRGAACLAVGA